jgi:hypothetical protein
MMIFDRSWQRIWPCWKKRNEREDCPSSKPNEKPTPDSAARYCTGNGRRRGHRAMARRRLEGHSLRHSAASKAPRLCRDGHYRPGRRTRRECGDLRLRGCRTHQAIALSGALTAGTAFAPRPDLAQRQGRGYVSYLNFLDWRTRNQAFSAIAAYDIRQDSPAKGQLSEKV